MPDVVTFGETMVLLTPPQPGRLRHATMLELRIGGAESNVAIALARLGISAGWASWLSDDELGEVVLARVRAEGVDTQQVRRVSAPTGLYLRERLPRGVQVYYYRRGSAASAMDVGAFDPDYLDGARVLHLSGITLALSESSRACALWAAQEARNRGVMVSFDVNYRSKLWPPSDARPAIESLLPLADLVFVSDDEAAMLWDATDEALLYHLAGFGPSTVVLKRGAQGCLALAGGALLEQGAFPAEVVDPIGAGDAFAAGYLAGIVEQCVTQECLRIANALGCFAVQSAGDYEGLPSARELHAFLEDRSDLGR